MSFKDIDQSEFNEENYKKMPERIERLKNIEIKGYVPHKWFNDIDNITEDEYIAIIERFQVMFAGMMEKFERQQNINERLKKEIEVLKADKHKL